MTWVFHLTHMKNLGAIIEEGLSCCSSIASDGGPSVDIGYQHIKDRRYTVPVPAAAAGVVADYVPFYFATRSPMLYTIHKGNVPGYQGQRGLVYLVCNAEKLTTQILCCFTDGHAVMAMTAFFEDPGQIEEKLDWEVLRAISWANTAEDSDRKRRRQAEFLAHRRVPWEMVEGIGVRDPATKGHVENIVEGTGTKHRPPIAIKPGWYY